MRALASRVQLVLDRHIHVHLTVAPACPPRACIGSKMLEDVVIEMVRRLRDAMPAQGTLLLAADGASAAPPDALLRAGVVDSPSGWLVLSVGSPDADLPNLNWQVEPPRADLARCARDCGATLSLRPLDIRGVQLVMHLPCDRRTHRGRPPTTAASTIRRAQPTSSETKAHAPAARKVEGRGSPG